MSEERVCGFCGNQTTVNWVHGHGECSICHSNIAECCSGECVQEVEVEVEDGYKDSKMPNVQDNKPNRPNTDF